MGFGARDMSFGFAKKEDAKRFYEAAYRQKLIHKKYDLTNYQAEYQPKNIKF